MGGRHNNRNNKRSAAGQPQNERSESSNNQRDAGHRNRLTDYAGVPRGPKYSHKHDVPQHGYQKGPPKPAQYQRTPNPRRENGKDHDHRHNKVGTLRAAFDTKRIDHPSLNSPRLVTTSFSDDLTWCSSAAHQDPFVRTSFPAIREQKVKTCLGVFALENGRYRCKHTLSNNVTRKAKDFVYEAGTAQETRGAHVTEAILVEMARSLLCKQHSQQAWELGRFWSEELYFSTDPVEAGVGAYMEWEPDCPEPVYKSVRYRG